MTPVERIPVAGLSQDLSELLRLHYAGAFILCSVRLGRVDRLFHCGVPNPVGDRTCARVA